MTTQNIDGIDEAAAANAVVAASARARHEAVLAEEQRIRDQRVTDLLNADMARRAIDQRAIDRLNELGHERGQTTYIVGLPPVNRAHHPLNLRRWTPLQWILAAVGTLAGLLVAAVTFQYLPAFFGNPQCDWRTILKIVWALGWSLIGFGLGGLIGFALNPNNRRPQ